jgi:shikimate dehydrogenase
MHAAALKQAGIDATYHTWHVRPAELENFIRKVRSQNYLGFNVTLPHKQTIMPYLDEISDAARVIGAVNTVAHQQGQLVGYNTDAHGFIRSLHTETSWSTTKGKSVTILGAGGAARAVAYGLLNEKAQRVFIINRTLSKAQALASDLATYYPSRVTASPWTDESMSAFFPECDLLVNATSVGLEGSSFNSLPLTSLPAHAIVSDLVYTPRATALLAAARRLGLKTHDGLGMLIYQGAEAFKIWFGQDPDIGVMRHALEQVLS